MQIKTNKNNCGKFRSVSVMFALRFSNNESNKYYFVCYFVLNMCIFRLYRVHEHNYTSRDDNRMINAVEKILYISVLNTRIL